jgi:ABC-2 type transport system permease protein
MKALLILRAVAFATYKEWAAYRSHMLVSLFVGPVFFLVQVAIWKAVFTTRETVNGLTLEQMITYYGIAALINYLIFDFADWNLQMLIRTGKFMTFLLRPVSHRYFAFSQKVGHRILGFSLEFVPMMLIFWFVFDVRLVPVHFMWMVISVLLSFVMMFLVNYCIGITGFWLTRTEGIRRMFSLLRDICAGVFIPLTFFPDFVQKLLFFLPFPYITYVPISVFLGSYEIAGMKLTIPQAVGMQALMVIAMWVLSEVLWRLGVRRFTGVGV